MRQSKNKKKILIIISDGESFENDPLASAKVAANEGISIFTLDFEYLFSNIKSNEGYHACGSTRAY